jgi:hypothetical protein
MEAEARARELLIEQMKFTIQKAQARAGGRFFLSAAV